MNAFVVLSVLVASCYAGYDKKQVGGPFPGPYPLPGGGQKPGTCPYNSEEGSLGNYCYNDYQCPGQQKCCFVYYSLQRRCQVPQELQRPGQCPYHYYGQVGTGYCNTDWQCPYGYKCCSGANGGVNTCRLAVYRGYRGGVNPVGGGVYPVGGGVYPVGGGGVYPVGGGGVYPVGGGVYPVGGGGVYPVGGGGVYPVGGGVYPGSVYPGLKKKVY
nr:perlwapin [Crassostrea gigas]